MWYSPLLMQEFVNKLRGLAYKKRGKLQRTVDPMNQIPKQVEAIGPSSLQPEIIQYTGTTAEIQGMKIEADLFSGCL